MNRKTPSQQVLETRIQTAQTGDLSAVSVKPSFTSTRQEATNVGAMVPASIPNQDIYSIYLEFVQLAKSDGDRARFLMNLLQRTISLSNALGGVVFVRDDDDDLAFGPRILSRELLSKHEGITERLAESAREAVRRREASVEDFDAESSLKAIFVPVLLPDRRPELMCLLVRTHDAASFVALLQLACGYINFWSQSRQMEHLDWEAGASATMLELVGRIQESGDIKDSVRVLSNELAEYLQCSRVAVGLVGGTRGQCRLAAISDSSEFDRRSKFTHTLEAVFSEAGSFAEPTVWPSIDNESALAHRKLHNLSGAATLISAPLHNSDSDLIAVVVLWWMDKVPDIDRTRRLLAALDSPLGAALHGKRGLSRRAVQRAGGEQGRYWLRFGLVAMIAVIIVGALLLPMPHRIKSSVLITPVNQRVVSAPFAGIIESSMVKVGDHVVQGQVLARFDGREFGWQLDELTTEYDRLGKKRDISLADQDATGAQISALEMQRVALKLKLLTSQMQELEITAPIAGVVLAHALDRREGSPVDKGQALLEIAPLDALLAEIEIPAEDISYIAPGQTAEFFMDAFPDHRFDIELNRILPRAEIREGLNVFVSEVPLEMQDTGSEAVGLLPGMRGTARIYAGERPLGWILFHKPVERLQAFTGWGDDTGHTLSITHPFTQQTHVDGTTFPTDVSNPYTANNTPDSTGNTGSQSMSNFIDVVKSWYARERTKAVSDRNLSDTSLKSDANRTSEDSK
ncbi:MAG: hypothetical protein DHS20C01_00850 [marine bacterium B5-7]|nr:MAG: hypothetical protein DHS20C01_00850 [marine bacterium B5-7]